MSSHTQTFSAVHLRVSCPACGAQRGSQCRNKQGVKLAGTHRDRVLKGQAAK